jgi:nucleotide-binding universal stress UspA family protein
MTETCEAASEHAQGPARPFRNILVAADGTHTGTRALELGAQLAGLCHAQLAVVHVVDSVRGFSPQFAWGPRTYEAEHLDHGRTFLNAMLEKLPAGLQTTPILRCGDPSIEIARAAIEYGADLLIVGGPSHHRLGRLLLGSVDEALLDEVHCSVLVIQPDAAVAPVKLNSRADSYD